jgi:hypothetical protein
MLKVLIAFMFSTIITFVASTYAAAFYGDLPLDFIYTPQMRRWTPEKKEFWRRVLDRLVLGFSDQQLITGFAMILIGLIKIRTVTSYHFFLILSLAMLSCSIHMTSVLSLRRYFQNHPEVAKARIAIMLLFAVLLSAALLFSQAPFAVQMDVRCPVICVWRRGRMFIRIFISGLFVVLLGSCYATAIVYIFPNAELLATTWLYTKPLEFLERKTGRRGLHEDFMHLRPRFIKIYISHFLQFLWWLLSFGATINIRLQSPRIVEGSEATFGFGQMLSILLILIPALGAFEVYWGMCQYHLTMTKRLMHVL